MQSPDINELGNRSPVPHSFEGFYQYSNEASRVNLAPRNEEIFESFSESNILTEINSAEEQSLSPSDKTKDLFQIERALIYNCNTFCFSREETKFSEEALSEEKSSVASDFSGDVPTSIEDYLSYYSSVRKITLSRAGCYQVPLIHKKDKSLYTSDHYKNLPKKLIDVYLRNYQLTQKKRVHEPYYEWIMSKSLKDRASIKKVSDAWAESPQFREELANCILELPLEEILPKHHKRNFDPKQNFCYSSILLGLKMLIQNFKDTKVSLGSVRLTGLWPEVEFCEVHD